MALCAEWPHYALCCDSVLLKSTLNKRAACLFGITAASVLPEDLTDAANKKIILLSTLSLVRGSEKESAFLPGCDF